MACILVFGSSKIDATMSVPSSMSRASAPVAPTRYELRRELARGGMGVVYLAFDRLAEREIAYKRLLAPKESSRALCAALFEREYDALAQLRHPNIVQVYDYGVDAEGAYYTMELLRGRDLFKAAPLELSAACSVLRQVASALALVHARRLVHRDVTPSNVYIDDQHRARLIDFGALSPFGTPSEAVGTPQFIAPEALSGDALDGRADLFSFGALAYWTLTRQTPIQARSMRDRKAQPDPYIAPPSAHVPGIPKELDELILGLLHPDRLARPASAAEVMQRLTAIADLPVEPDESKVAFSYLAHPPLVGRDAALSQSQALLQQTLAGARGMLLVTGSPGSGRSALLDQIVIDAQLAGATVLRAQGGAQAPFELAQGLIRAGMPTAVTDADSARESVSSVQPKLRAVAANGAAPANPVDAAARHADRIDELQRTLLTLSGANPMVVLVDDAERADKESLAVLAALVRAAEKLPLLLVLTARQRPEKGNSAWSKLAQQAQSMSLQPLSQSDIIELVTAVFGDVANARRLALWLDQQSGGNPGVCMDLLRQLLREGVLQYVNGRFILPYDVSSNARSTLIKEVSTQQVQQLSAVSLEVARALSLQRERLSSELLTAGLSLTGAQVLDAIAELVNRGIVRSANDRVWIASEDARNAVDAGLDESARRALHLKIANGLRDHGYERDHCALVAANFVRGGDERGEQLLTSAMLQDPLAMDVEMTVPLLEELLVKKRSAGLSDKQCLLLLCVLAHATYFVSYSKQRQYSDRALPVLFYVSGVQLARSLSKYLGGTLALIVGLTVGAVRYALTPRSERLPSFQETLGTTVAMGSGGVAAAVSAFDAAAAVRLMEQLSALRVFKLGTAARTAYEFALATAESGQGKWSDAGARYASVLDAVTKGVPGLSPGVLAGYRFGSLYGGAQAELSRGSATTLEIVDQLRHPFYAAHAESTRMAYYAMRGDEELAQTFRDKAELAALRNGMSWSAITVLTVRAAYSHMFSRNPMGLMESISELTRLIEVAPNIVLYRDSARAYRALLSGQAAKAVEIYETVLSDPRHRWLPVPWLDRMFYAEALSAMGEHQKSKAACLAILADCAALLTTDSRRNLVLQQLALAEARLGEIDAAKARIANCVATITADDSPLLIGSLYRDAALVALCERNVADFNRHLEAMSRTFRATRNPWLIRQCEQLAAHAQHEGIPVGLDLPKSGISGEQLHTALFGTSDVGSGAVQTTSMPCMDEARPTTFLE